MGVLLDLTLSVSVSEESSTLEEVHEPFLIQEGFLIKRTPKGRVATLKSYDKLEIISKLAINLLESTY